MISRVLQGYLVLFVVIYLTHRYKTDRGNLLQTIDALQKSENEKDDFLANVSHEIRTPINTICGISEIILQDELSSKTRNDVLSIQSASKNLTSVVGDILDFSDLQKGDFDEQFRLPIGRRKE